MLRAYEDDKVQVRVLVGGFEEGHNFGVQGMHWLFEPSDPNSGFRNNQMMGISEHYEFEIPQFPRSTKTNEQQKFVDYRYAPGAAVDDLWNGLWGLLRAYDAKQNSTEAFLHDLPNNLKGSLKIEDKNTFNEACPKTAPIEPFDVTAVLARRRAAREAARYNHRSNQAATARPDPILYVRTDDLARRQAQARRAGRAAILRANAGDCIQLTLHNACPSGTAAPDLPAQQRCRCVEKFNANQVAPFVRGRPQPATRLLRRDPLQRHERRHNPVQP